MKPADEAIVLVGGLGTRLRAVVPDLPKPLAPVAGRPFLAWVMDQLAGNGIRHVVLATGYMSDVVEAAIGASWRGMQVEYSVEQHALGTGGAVRQACQRLRGNAVHVLNGDTYLDYSAAGIADAVSESGANIGVALARVDDVARYGAVECDSGRITRFREKGGSGPGYVNAGCYFLGSKAIAALPQLEAYSFETEVLVPMTAAGSVCGYADTRGFIDIGVPDDYLRAQTIFGG